MAIQHQGSSGVVDQVETNTAAVRTVIRPTDIGSLGAYSLGAASGVMAAGLASASPIFSFRYAPGGTTLCLVKRILFDAVNAGTAFAAGTCVFNLFDARSFTASDTGGTSVLPTLNKLRTSFATTGLTAALISSTATLTAGTRTLDSQPLAALVGVASATASIVIIPQATPFFDRRVGEWPLVLANNEGFVIQATVAATGTWTFKVQVDWEEVSTYGTGLAS